MIYQIGIIVFFVFIVLTGVLVSKKVQNSTDYFVSGRNAPTLYIVGSLVASVLSAVAFTGEAGFAYDGYPVALFLFVTLQCCGYILGALFFGRYIRRSEALTLPEFFGNRFNSKKVRIAAGLTTVVAIGAYLVSVTQASALVLGSVLEIDYVPAMLIIWVAYTAFTFLSGAKGVLVTDTIMFFFFFISTLVSIPIILSKAGGWPDAFINMSAQNPDVFKWHGITGEAAYMGQPWEVFLWIAFMGLAWGFVTAVSPWQTSRYLMAKNEHVVLRSGMLSPIPVVVIYILLMTVMGAFPLINDAISPSETAYIWGTMNIMPPIIGTIILSGIMAAGLSSCSTFLQLIGNSVAQDIIIPKKDDKRLLLKSRISMLASSFVVLLITISPAPAVLTIAYAAGTIFAASWGPVAIASIFSRKVTKQAAFWSIIVGMTIVLIGEVLTITGVVSFPIYFEPFLIGIVASTLVLFIVPRFTKITEAELTYLNQLLVTPKEMYDPNEIRRTKTTAKLMIAGGVALSIFTVIYYYIPTQIL